MLLIKYNYEKYSKSKNKQQEILLKKNFFNSTKLETNLFYFKNTYMTIISLII